MLRLDAPKNNNYAAQVVRVGTIVKLEGLDNLVGVPVLGHQALTNHAEVGDLRLAFTSETQLSEDYAHWNNLYRHPEKNRDVSEKGYLEDSRRIRALKLRGHVSNALLMPLTSLEYTGFPLNSLQVGDTFDTLNGHDICKKYELPRRHQPRQKTKLERAFKRVDRKLFPEHLETDAYWRNKHLLKAGQEVVVSQKLHGTSWRGGRVPVLRKPSWFERFLIWIRVAELA